MGGQVTNTNQAVAAQPVALARFQVSPQLTNLFDTIGKVDLQDGNTSNFNKPLGDGYSINQLVRHGGANIDFGNGMTTGDKDAVLNKAISGTQQELGSTAWYNVPKEMSLDEGIAQSRSQENSINSAAGFLVLL